MKVKFLIHYKQDNTSYVLYCQSLILYAKKHGITKTVIYHSINQHHVYYLIKRYYCTLQSLSDIPQRLHHPINILSKH